MLKKLDDFRYSIPKSYKKGMRIEGLIFANQPLIQQIEKDLTIDQVANVATLPGLVGCSLAMPDAHQGYGFCIGGVAAADLSDGVISAGGVGFDINCGVRLLNSPFQVNEIKSKLQMLLDDLFQSIPCGLGQRGVINLSLDDLNPVLDQGAQWPIQKKFGLATDLAFIEEMGRITSADASMVGQKAKNRGHTQLGSLGSGNHFVEIQMVTEVFDSEIANRFGLYHDQIVILIHTGSRGLGHQVCTDHLNSMQEAMKKYRIHVVDRQLACVPIRSKEGQHYLKAMAAAANFAFANRQIVTHQIRKSFGRVMGSENLKIVYDVCHNIAKEEEHRLNGKQTKVLVHRKGATRAFPKGHPDLPAEVRDWGQPVLVPGSMGTCSYVLLGSERAMLETFGSSCHGAGRAKSRSQARRETTPEELLRIFRRKNILIKAQTNSGLVEEKPDAYKDVNQVVEVIHKTGIATKLAKLKPLAVMKG